MTTVNETCSLCGDTHALDAMPGESREQLLRRYHFELRDGAVIDSKCVLTPPSQSFALAALDQSTFETKGQ